MTNLFLFFPLLGAFCFFAGEAVVGVLQLAAIRQERPSQVHAFLRRAPFGAALVGVGALLTLGFGIALAEHKGLGLSPAWIQASLGLWVAAMALGAFGGRTARHARHLAAKLAAEGDAPSPELRAMVAARAPLWASYASFALLLAIVVLMVWQPGSSEAWAPAVTFPETLQQQILDVGPEFAFLPTQLPSGVKYSGFMPAAPGFHLNFAGGHGQDELSFSVYPAEMAYPDACDPPPSSARGVGADRVNGYQVIWENDSEGEAAYRCVTYENRKIILQADALRAGVDVADLETVVAYAAPFN